MINNGIIVNVGIIFYKYKGTLRKQLPNLPCGVMRHGIQDVVVTNKIASLRGVDVIKPA
jgi:hypothetical protein